MHIATDHPPTKQRTKFRAGHLSSVTTAVAAAQPPTPSRMDAIRAAALADLATVPEYAAAIGKCERSVWSYIHEEGLPVTYIGRSAYVILSKATEFWAARSKTAPTRERRRRDVAQAA